MAEWNKCSLDEVMDLIGGGTPNTSIPEYWNGTIPWLSVKDFKNDNRYVYSTEKTITELGLKHSSTKLLKRDDIIISARGTFLLLLLLLLLLFLGPLPRHMEVPRLGVESEL